MITDPRVFDDAYLPRELMHREAEVGHLSHVLEPALEGRADKVDDVMLSGPSGVGKTVLARHTLERFEAETTAYHAHVRCLGQTATQVLRESLSQHPRVRSDQYCRNMTVDELREVLVDVVDDPFVVILDEADGLETEVFEALTGIHGLSLVVICHNPDRWLARHDTVDQRRFADIHLDRYSVDQLADILWARAKEGLIYRAAPRSQLEAIADESAGVARRGIQALRAAAEIASERGHRRIQEEDVDDSFERARKRIREANLRSLPFHHQVLYAIVQEAGEIEATELHDRYDTIAEDVYHGHEWTPIGKRARRNKLAKLREYDLIASEGPEHSRLYTVHDKGVTSDIGPLNGRIIGVETDPSDDS